MSAPTIERPIAPTIERAVTVPEITPEILPAIVPEPAAPVSPTPHRWQKAIDVLRAADGTIWQSHYQLYADGHYCAVGALLRAAGSRPVDLRNMLSINAAQRVEELYGVPTHITSHIMHLNDANQMSFGRIADWLSEQF